MSVIVPVMDVRHVGVTMPEHFVPVRMAVGLRTIPCEGMRMAMMLVMHVGMLMLCGRVGVRGGMLWLGARVGVGVLVVLRGGRGPPTRHEDRCEPERAGGGLAEHPDR